MLDLVVIPGPSFRHFLPPPLLCSALRLLTRATFCKSEGRITHLSPLHRLASLAVLIEKMAFTQNCVSAAGMAVVRALPLCLALRNPLFPFLGGTQGHRSTIPGLFFSWTNVAQLPWNPPYALKGCEERLHFLWLCCGTRRPIHPVPLLSWTESVEDTFVLLDPARCRYSGCGLRRVDNRDFGLSFLDVSGKWYCWKSRVACPGYPEMQLLPYF